MSSRELWTRVILLALLASLLACSSKSSGERLIGAWESSYEGEEIVMTFDKDGQLTLKGEGYSQTASYTTDYSADPAHLDIQLGDETIETIIEFVDDDTFRMENNFPGEPRPTKFGADTITFTRQKE